MTTTAGIEVRHSRSCPARQDGRCGCKPTYQAQVWSPRDSKAIKRTFPTLAAAKLWRSDAQSSLRKGTMRAPTMTTVREAAEAWLEGARSGAVRKRGGERYKPSAIRSYEASLRLRLIPHFGGAKLSDIQRIDVQDFAERLLAEGLDASTIRNTLMPLRAIFRRAVARGEVAVNPTSAVELPAVRGKRDRIAAPDEAASLIGAVPERDRAVWATACYAGLRLGELLALRWEDLDFNAGVIRVERSWDRVEGFVEPKSRAGRRVVPIASVLRTYLLEHRLRAGRFDGLVFGRDATTPWNPWTLRDRAQVGWKKAGLAAITLHECRHTFASLMIAAGVNAKALSTYMGHASVTITYDRYGHLMPGNEEEAAGLLDAYLTRATVAQTVAQSAPSA